MRTGDAIASMQRFVLRMRQRPSTTFVLACYLMAAAALCAGTLAAASFYPRGFNWLHIVASWLGSKSANPLGAIYFSAGFTLTMAFLIPVMRFILAGSAPAGPLLRFAGIALHFALAGGIVFGLERMLITDLNDQIPKAHELLVLVSFLAWFLGLIALSMHRLKHRTSGPWPAILALAPLLIVGIGQGILYLDEIRELGWIDRGPPGVPAPFWLRFAFWEWVALASLLAVVGLLLLQTIKQPTRSASPLSANSRL